MLGHTRLISILTCFFFMVFVCVVPAGAHASEVSDPPPQLLTLKKGECAPFAGTLFSTSAAAQLLVDLETTQAKCDLRKEKALSLLRAELQLKIDLRQASLDALQYKHTSLLKIKEDQIKFLQEQVRPSPWYESGEFWFAMCVVGGILITVGAGYAIGQASK